MKTSHTIPVLMVLLIASLVINAGLSYQYLRSVRKLQEMQSVRIQITRVLTVFQAMVGDATEYGKRNPAILPILQPILSQATPPKPTPPPTVKPAK